MLQRRPLDALDLRRSAVLDRERRCGARDDRRLRDIVVDDSLLGLRRARYRGKHDAPRMGDRNLGEIRGRLVLGYLRPRPCRQRHRLEPAPRDEDIGEIVGGIDDEVVVGVRHV